MWESLSPITVTLGGGKVPEMKMSKDDKVLKDQFLGEKSATFVVLSGDSGDWCVMEKLLPSGFKR